MALIARKTANPNTLAAALLKDLRIEVYEGASVDAKDLTPFFEVKSRTGNPKNAVVVVTAADGVYHLIVRPEQIEHLPNMEGGYDSVYIMLRETWEAWKDVLPVRLVLEHLEVQVEA